MALEFSLSPIAKSKYSSSFEDRITEALQYLEFYKEVNNEFVQYDVTGGLVQNGHGNY